MDYRFLGKTGLQVSALGFGNMINFEPKDEETNIAIVKRAFELGINFFDTAENYGGGKAEEALGRAFKALNLPRSQLVVSTKLINRTDGTGNPVNRTWLTNRKHIIEGTDGALKRLQLKYVDVIFCHAYDEQTQLEEICRGFNQVIEDGKAFYWATSNWRPELVQEAINICDRLGLHRPIAEQTQYNQITRQTVEVDFAPLFEQYGYGTTVWSPLAGGVLAGKYNDGIPEDSRATIGLSFVPKSYMEAKLQAQLAPERIEVYRALAEYAKELGCTQSQLAVAWVLRNKDVNVAIIGARTVAQLEDTYKALEVVKKFTPEVDAKLEAILKNTPTAPMNWRNWAPMPSRR